MTKPVPAGNMEFSAMLADEHILILPSRRGFAGRQNITSTILTLFSFPACRRQRWGGFKAGGALNLIRSSSINKMYRPSLKERDKRERQKPSLPEPYYYFQISDSPILYPQSVFSHLYLPPLPGKYRMHFLTGQWGSAYRLH